MNIGVVKYHIATVKLAFGGIKTMTQRIFDVENKKDMADLWNILPDDYCKIEKRGRAYCFYKTTYAIDYYESFSDFFKINWHDKKEITRPVQECTEADIGKICLFWGKGQRNAYGVLESVTRMKNGGYDYQSTENRLYSHCRRLTKQEIEELI